MRNASKLACRLANNTHAHMAVEGGNLEVVVAEVARELGYSGLKEMQLRVLYARVWRQTRFSAMCAWVLFANLQANLSPFRCIPHYVTQNKSSIGISPDPREGVATPD